MNKELITVFCPLYNKESYIARALDSILIQKTDFEYRILVIDDFSRDGGVNVVKDYMAKYPDKITLIQNEKNIKTLATSLKGYRLIKSKYFTVLDPDDYWISESFIQDSVSFLEKNPEFTTFMGNTYIVNEGKKSKTVYLGEKREIISIDDIENMKSGHTSATFFKNIFNKNELDIVENYIGTEDEKSFEGDIFRNFLHIKYGKCYYDPKIVSVYNITGDGIWTSLSDFQQKIENARLFLNMFFFLGKIKPKYFLQNSYNFCASIDKSFSIASSEYRNLSKKIIKYCNEFNIPIAGENRDLCFFFPSRMVGGYEIFFMRIARIFAEEMLFNVYYIDYEDGFVKKELTSLNSPVKFINYNDSDDKINIDANLTVVTSVTWTFQMPQFINPESKFIFYVAHPKSYEWLQGRSGKSSDFLKAFFKFASASYAVPFMDYSCFQALQNKVGFEITPDYIPVSVLPKKVIKFPPIINENEINIAWVGRLDWDKIFSLENLIENLYNLKTNLKKNIHIIGEGAAKDVINSSKYGNEINIIHKSTILNKDLEEYLSNNVDVLFAMGTSLLEGASIGIPSVLTVSSEEKFDYNKFLWIFDLKSFDLGVYKDYLSKYDECAITIDDLVREIYEKSRKSEIGSLCLDFFAKNHNIDNSVACFMDVASKSKLYNSDYCYFVDNHGKNDFSIELNNKKVHNNLLKNIVRRFKKYSYNFIYFTISAPIISLIFSQASRNSVQSKYKKYKKLLKDQRIVSNK